jgi:hypothetical protein
MLSRTSLLVRKKLVQPCLTTQHIRHLNIPGMQKLVQIPEAKYEPDVLPPVAEWRFKPAFEPIKDQNGNVVNFQPLPADRPLLESMPDATAEDLYYVRQADWIAKQNQIKESAAGKFEMKYSVFFIALGASLFGIGMYEDHHRKEHPFWVPEDEYYRSRIKEKGAGWFPVETCQFFEFSCFRRGLDKADVLMKQLEQSKQ